MTIYDNLTNYFSILLRNKKKHRQKINTGAPIIGSAPHFYNGDNQFVYGVIGLIPDKEKHETFFILEAVCTVSNHSLLDHSIKMMI